MRAEGRERERNDYVFPLQIPPNSCLNSIADGIAGAWKEYPKQR